MIFLECGCATVDYMTDQVFIVAKLLIIVSKKLLRDTLFKQQQDGLVPTISYFIYVSQTPSRFLHSFTLAKNSVCQTKPITTATLSIRTFIYITLRFFSLGSQCISMKHVRGKSVDYHKLNTMLLAQLIINFWIYTPRQLSVFPTNKSKYKSVLVS